MTNILIFNVLDDQSNDKNKRKKKQARRRRRRCFDQNEVENVLRRSCRIFKDVHRDEHRDSYNNERHYFAIESLSFELRLFLTQHSKSIRLHDVYRVQNAHID
jgi:hypothetical protein